MSNPLDVARAIMVAATRAAESYPDHICAQHVHALVLRLDLVLTELAQLRATLAAHAERGLEGDER